MFRLRYGCCCLEQCGGGAQRNDTSADLWRYIHITSYAFTTLSCNCSIIPQYYSMVICGPVWHFCIQAATILLFLKGYQLHLTCRKYYTCIVLHARYCWLRDCVKLYQFQQNVFAKIILCAHDKYLFGSHNILTYV